MALVVLIEDGLTDHAERDMRRWWGGNCKKRVANGETYFEVCGKFRLYEGVKRLASFGVRARIARRRLNWERWR
jgi:hypothetical protein